MFLSGQPPRLGMSHADPGDKGMTFDDLQEIAKAEAEAGKYSCKY